MSSSMAASPWQVGKSLQECMKQMFEGQHLTDCIFEVGEEFGYKKFIKAHSTILAARSPIFYSMFDGRISLDKKEPIKVPDMHPDAFNILLQFLYSDEVDLSTVDHLSYVILHAANVYFIDKLGNLCRTHITAELNNESVLTVLDEAMKIHDHKLIDFCKEFIASSTLGVLQEPAFCEISHEVLCTILEMNSLTISEFELFKVCIRWVCYQCKYQGLPCEAEKQKSILGRALNLIRFTSMTKQQFENFVANTGLLNGQEMHAVYRGITSKDLSMAANLGFSVKPRDKHVPLVLHRYSYYDEVSLIAGKEYKLAFRVSSHIIFKGLGLASPCLDTMYNDIQIDIKTRIDSKTTEQLYSEVVNCPRSTSTGAPVLFQISRRILLEPNILYDIRMTPYFVGKIPSTIVLAGIGGYKRISSEQIVFEFEKGSSATSVIKILYTKV